MPKHVCGAWLDPDFMRTGLRALGLRHLNQGRCKATAIKTKRGAWRCPLHGGLSSGPKSAEGKARIAAAARERWAAYRAAKAMADT